MTAERGAGSPGVERTASVGVSLERREDRPLLTGNASFTDDLVGPRHLHVAAARSQYAHATIQSIDTADAETLEEVHGVFTATDLVRADLREGYPVRHVPEGIDEELPDRPLLANEKVRYQGEPIAVVVAETREGAQVAADAISVEYDRLDAVTDPQSAESADATVHESSPSNRAFTWTAGDVDATKAAFEAAEQSVSLDLSNQRLAPVPIEPRALVAEYSEGEIDVRMSTQTPHHHRTFFAAALGLPESSIRVRAPSVGGGFGSKDHFYAIEALACWMATKFSRPVAAQVQRGETFQTDAHGRGHETVASLAVDNDGTIRGLRAKTTADLGAYISTSAAAITTNAYGRMLSGAYAIPTVYCEVDGVFTNTAPTGAYRGAGRPEATFVVERLVSLAATELGLDPVEFRRRNLIDADDFPYQTPVGFTYDSGDYERSLDAALELVDYEAVRECQAARQSDDRYLGIGISTFVEVAGYGPIGDGGDGPIPPLYEGGRVRFHPDGHVTAYCGTADQGQGHETTYAQVLADVLGVDYEDIEVVEADTEVVAYGTGTFGSRSASVGTASLVESAERVVEKARRIAAEALEVATSDVEFANGVFSVTGAPDRSIHIRDVAERAYLGRDLPSGEDPGLEASATVAPDDFNFPFGTHVCVLEVDINTGEIEIQRYAAVDDCGTRLNPRIVEGQIHGGIAQGLGQALQESVFYDDAGNLITGSLQDYALPKAEHVPEMVTDHTETPSPLNPTGAKGIGESGTIAAPPAVVNATVDALRQAGQEVDHLDMPLTPERVWRAANDRKTEG